MLQLFFEPSDVSDLYARYEMELRFGRAVLKADEDLSLAPGTSCQVVIVHPLSKEWCPVAAKVVRVSPKGATSGVVVDFKSAGDDAFAILKAFVEGRSSRKMEPVAPTDTALESESPEELSPLELTAPEMPRPSELGSSGDDSKSILRLPSEETVSPESESGRRGAKESSPAKNVQMRVRQLSPPEREKLARRGALHERTALERAFGPSVWEALLQNPAITGQEVARIAKNRTVPAPILGVIASSGAWLSRSDVRRSLLSNTRLPPNLIERVLRSLPKTELKQVAAQTAYPQRVRAVAQRLGT